MKHYIYKSNANKTSKALHSITLLLQYNMNMLGINMDIVLLVIDFISVAAVRAHFLTVNQNVIKTTLVRDTFDRLREPMGNAISQQMDHAHLNVKHLINTLLVFYLLVKGAVGIMVDVILKLLKVCQTSIRDYSITNIN